MLEPYEGNRPELGRYFLFLALSMAIIVANFYFMSRFSKKEGGDLAQKPPNAAEASAESAKDAPDAPQSPKPVSEADDSPESGDKPVATDQSASAESDANGAAPNQGAAEEQAAVAAPSDPLPAYYTLGTLDSKQPYRMLVTLTNQGAAVVRVELNNPRYCDTEDWGGYLGRIFEDPGLIGDGCPVEVVGPGTPAAEAGLRPGDLLQSVDGQKVLGVRTLEAILARTRPGQKVTLGVLRNNEQLQLTATLRRKPLELIRPEGSAPPSFLTTLAQFEKDRLLDRRLAFEEKVQKTESPIEREELIRRELDLELPGVSLRGRTWRVLPEDADPRRPQDWPQASPADLENGTRETIRFAVWLPEKKLVVTKTYRIAKGNPQQLSNLDETNYHLTLTLECFNVGDREVAVAYQLDGPNGLPTEGSWYARKMSNSWSAVGLRDVAVKLGSGGLRLVSCYSIARDKAGVPWKDESENVTAVGVDAQYFSAVLIPQKESANSLWFEDVRPYRIGTPERDYEFLTNVSCRLTGLPVSLRPGESLSHTYNIFLGPKRQDLLSAYGLSGLIQYGWFWFVAEPMTRLLHFFHDYVVFNYGLAILMLTAMVRLCMFPVSRKQTLNAQKMQELQPEIKRIQEQHKDLQERNERIQELFRRHNYNPFSGCLVLFIQLPIFIGLYKALAIDVELRQAPLISEAVRWCANLAAPDMLFNWSFLWPDWFNRGHGMFALGPYFNLLPILTIVLFLWQQKMMMPPPADETAAMQQKVMTFMMIFMGVLFYKVPSGLCLYFIISSLWGLGERQVLLQMKPAGAEPAAKKPSQPRWKAAVKEWAEKWDRTLRQTVDGRKPPKPTEKKPQQKPKVGKARRRG
ncbi:membrane protein insertase YidC [Thermopirellula anaerolimosa]